jgi:CheY-like chemotaxis protein
LMRELRKHEQTRDTCFVVLTAVNFEAEKKRAQEVGCRLFLSKPVEPQTLVEHIRKILTEGAKRS